jgi:hypothetical protein
MASGRYFVMTVECGACKTKQKIHVALGTGAEQERNETIPCIQCSNLFRVALPDKFIRGPYPA